MENEYILHNFIIWPYLCQKVSKLVEI